MIPPRRLPSRPRPRGFTLIELLVVISLIAVLAAMVLAGAGGIMKKMKRDQIRSFLAEIGNGLESYRVDNAIYPLNPDPRNPGGSSGSLGGYSGPDSDAVAGSVVLYKHLSGDFNMDGQVDEDETVYVERLDYWSNSDRGGRAPETVRSVPLGSGYAVVDPLGSPLRYLADPPGYTPQQRKTRNPSYDLWSIAGASSDSPDFSDQSTWITNWGTE